MSVLDLDFYKLTMLQFIWKHYADVPVTFRLHSRKQALGDIVDPRDLVRRIASYQSQELTGSESDYLRSLGIFDESFIIDLEELFYRGPPEPYVDDNGDVYVSGDWFKASLWETVILSAVSEQYSVHNAEKPDEIKRFADIYAIGQSGARWADFGTRRRWSARNHAELLAGLVQANAGEKYGLVGTSNVSFAMQLGLTPIGTYAHELEMVLRPYHVSEFQTTRNVLTKWGHMYPRELRIALTDTYTTPQFLKDHGWFLLDNDWRGVRLDSGDPFKIGTLVDEWLCKNRAAELDLFDVVFSDSLDAETIVGLQDAFEQRRHPAIFINPLYGWGTGLTNPNSDLSLVMKATESRGIDTYKLTDDNAKSIRQGR